MLQISSLGMIPNFVAQDVIYAICPEIEHAIEQLTSVEGMVYFTAALFVLFMCFYQHVHNHVMYCMYIVALGPD